MAPRSFKKTVQMYRKSALVKRNTLLVNKIEKMNNYITSINTLSPIVSYVTNKRREERMKRQYASIIKSKLRGNYKNM